MTTKIPDLPPEVVDLIIDQTQTTLTRQPLHPQASLTEAQKEEIQLVHRTRCAYLLVSRTFRRRVLSYIFASLQFTITDDSNSTDRLDSFLDILKSSIFTRSTSEHLGWHVHGVSLAVNFPNAGRIGFLANPSNIICHQSIVNILQSLHEHAPNLALLSMKIERGLSMSWEELHPTYKAAFQALVRLNTMRTLETCNITRFPVNFLKGTHLERLDIQLDAGRPPRQPFGDEDPSINLVGGDPLTAGINLQDPPLKVLITDNTCPFGTVPDISPPGSMFSGLKALKAVTKSPKDAEHTWLILSNSPVLEKLILCVVKEFVIPPPRFNLGSLSGLQSLAIQHRRLGNSPYNPTNDESLARILNFLQPPTPLPALKHLDLVFDFIESNVRTDFFYPVPTSGVLSQWEQLDILLMGPKYPALESLTIFLMVEVIQNRDYDIFDNEVFLATTIEKLRDQFPRLASTDKIQFDVKLESEVTQRRGYQ